MKDKIACCPRHGSRRSHWQYLPAVDSRFIIEIVQKMDMLERWISGGLLEVGSVWVGAGVIVDKVEPLTSGSHNTD